MNIRELTYFLAVIDCGNFTDAADKCCVTQPTLSAGIKKLEETLDIQLIIRGTKNTGGVRPTAAGIKILKIVRELILQAEKIKKIARDSKNPFHGDLRIGAFPTLCPYLMPKILPILKQNLPNMRFYIFEEKSNNLIEMLKKDILDIAFLASSDDNFIHSELHHHFVSQHLFFDPFYLAVFKNHVFDNKTQIATSDIMAKELLLLEEGHCLRNQALEFCQFLSKDETDFRGTSLETLLSMVRMGTGYTLIPKIAITKFYEDIRYIPLKDETIGRNIYAIYNTRMLATSIIEKFQECINSQNIIF
jgi:LysR family hydrogen peroxide-inducible transcriptional activator